VNSVTTSFNTNMGQMTEMYQRKNEPSMAYMLTNEKPTNCSCR